jgi:tRNA pseudouridine32 synthase/23S rRNA pseudouridine746 synthase
MAQAKIIFTVTPSTHTFMPNSLISKYFSPFVSDISHCTLPDKFTYPFCYQAHPLALAASEELQSKLISFHPADAERQGRMYGVLVVKNAQGQLGYLSALSGGANETIAHNGFEINFVPPIHQAYSNSEFEQKKQVEINQINQSISQLTANPDIERLTTLLAVSVDESEQEIQALQRQMRENKKARKEKRAWLSVTDLPDDEQRSISIELSRESVTDKKALLALKQDHKAIIGTATQDLQQLTDEIELLKKRRKRLSTILQKHFFKQYQMLNIQGVRKDLTEIFAETILQKPPAGSGDCAAPKLLQYAFDHALTPLCMAEFWWGKQPKSEIRKHKNFYPACQGKCQPILNHMLIGMDVESNPLLINPAERKQLEIIFQDEHVVVVNKPADLLSVPGKSIKDSVYTRIKAQFPHATGGLIIHRLDMATSGLLMLALNERSHKHIQQQFINKEVNKRYVAIIDGTLDKMSGEIRLPLCVDVNDRPRQMVCYEHGKYAETHWQVIEEKVGKTKLFLYPITGRTHQLRMHCAHPDGLNLPILGDGLYGIRANRLHLHAQRLSFVHPITKARLTFEVDAEF